MKKVLRQRMSDPSTTGCPSLPPAPLLSPYSKFPMPMAGGGAVTVKVEPEEEDDDVVYLGTFPAEQEVTCESPHGLEVLNIPMPQDKAPICKRHVRGHCDRDHCLYRHVFELGELRGLFAFCRDFQYRVCARLTCPFVHASAAEEMTFLKTGEVPLALRVRAKRKETPQTLKPAPPPIALTPSQALLPDICHDTEEGEPDCSYDVSSVVHSVPCANMEQRLLDAQHALALLSRQCLPPDTAPPPALADVYEASYTAHLRALLEDMLPSQRIAASAATLTASHFENLMHFLANRNS